MLGGRQTTPVPSFKARLFLLGTKRLLAASIRCASIDVFCFARLLQKPCRAFYLPALNRLSIPSLRIDQHRLTQNILSRTISFAPNKGRQKNSRINKTNLFCILNQKPSYRLLLGFQFYCWASTAHTIRRGSILGLYSID